MLKYVFTGILGGPFRPKVVALPTAASHGSIENNIVETPVLPSVVVLRFGRQICTDCPEALIPHHVKPIPEPTCVVAARLLPQTRTNSAWDGAICPSWCMAEQPVSTAPTQSGFVDVRMCGLENAPPGQ